MLTTSQDFTRTNWVPLCVSSQDGFRRFVLHRSFCKNHTIYPDVVHCIAKERCRFDRSLIPPLVETLPITSKKCTTHFECGVKVAYIRDLGENGGVSSSTCLGVVGNERLFRFPEIFESCSNLSYKGLLGKALDTTDFMDQQGIHDSTNIDSNVLQRCLREKNLAVERELSAFAENGFETKSFLSTFRTQMFDTFDSLPEAIEVFCHMSEPDAFRWASVMSTFVKLGQNEQVLKLYHQMQRASVEPNGPIFVVVLKACSSMAASDQGKQIHGQIIGSGHESDMFVCNTLIDMYFKCGSIEDAHITFERMPQQDVVTWNALIAGYTLHGQGQKALHLFRQMHQAGIEPNRVTLICSLKACSSIAALDQGRQIHAQIIQNGCQMGLNVGNLLIGFYAKCGILEDSCMVFDRLLERDVVTWSTLIGGYAQHGRYKDALQLFNTMQLEGISPNRITYVSMLKACSHKGGLDHGRQIHTHIIESGFETGLLVGNTLVDMYAKCGSLENACTAFDRLSKQDVVTWSVLIAGYAQHGFSQDALHLFKQMQQSGMKPNKVTFVSILKMCSYTGFLEQGRQIHVRIIECGKELDVVVGSALIDMYWKCGNLEDARIVFERLPKQDVVAWSTLIAGHGQHGHFQEALWLFEQMELKGIEPESVTFVCTLRGCSSTEALEQGKVIHAHIIRGGFESDVLVGNTLMDMYTRCGSLKSACVVFDRMPKRDVVTWSVLISAYTKHEDSHQALQLFHQMHRDGIEPNRVVFLCVLKACSSIAALKQGRQIHSQITESGLELELSVGNTLIDMYAKSGSFQDAFILFHRLPKQDVVTWNAMIAGCALDNNYLSGFHYFKALQQTGLNPDNVTFLCLLSACSHCGLVNEGCLHFKSMREDHDIVPTVGHYNAVVDLLGRAECWNEAEDLLESVPFETNTVGWMSLLNSCKIHTNVDLGRQCFDVLLSMDHSKTAGYVLMSNIYSHAGMCQDAEKIEELRRLANGWKKPAKSFIEIDDCIHDFIVGEKSHPQSNDIYAKLKTLSMQMRDEGHTTGWDSVLDSVSNDKKEDAFCGHSEKLAIAFGLICTPLGTTIRVSKNLRMCADCHISTKMISKIEKREIIVVDAYCIHRFQDGLCTCNDHC